MDLESRINAIRTKTPHSSEEVSPPPQPSSSGVNSQASVDGFMSQVDTAPSYKTQTKAMGFSDSFSAELMKSVPLQRRANGNTVELVPETYTTSGGTSVIQDEDGRISDFIQSLMEEAKTLIIPVSLTTIPSHVKPATHDIVLIGEESFFVSRELSLDTIITEQIIRDLSAGRAVRIPISIPFFVQGAEGTTYTMTPAITTEILKRYGRYMPKVVTSDDPNCKLSLVLGDYTYVRS